MNWEAISAIGEIIGAIAVIVSLVYLAVQVRSSSRATKATVFQGLHDSFAQFDLLLITNSDLRELLENGCAGDTKLTARDRARFSHLLAQLFDKYELFFSLHRERMFSAEVENVMSRIVAKRIQRPGVKVWLRDNHHRFSKDFVMWINETIDA